MKDKKKETVKAVRVGNMILTPGRHGIPVITFDGEEHQPRKKVNSEPLKKEEKSAPDQRKAGGKKWKNPYHRCSPGGCGCGLCGGVG